jgi:dihydroorotase
VADGTISCLATDHAPHPAGAKARGFRDAPFGIVGLETAVGVTHAVLVASGLMSECEWVRRWTVGPAAVLGRPAPTLAAGAPAQVTLLDLDSPWTVSPERFQSKSRNTPWGGRTLRGRAMMTFLRGRLVWCAEEARSRLVGPADK